MKEICLSLLSNRILVVSVLSWFVAQVVKALLYMVMNKEFRVERLFGSGGMPSSHAATVCALTTATYIQYGINSFPFAISFILATVVMHDARGVRYEAGKQATIINKLMESISTDTKVVWPKLKELVGHTPSQVLIGGIMGIIIAIFFY